MATCPSHFAAPALRPWLREGWWQDSHTRFVKGGRGFQRCLPTLESWVEKFPPGPTHPSHLPATGYCPVLGGVRKQAAQILVTCLPPLPLLPHTCLSLGPLPPAKLTSSWGDGCSDVCEVGPRLSGELEWVRLLLEGSSHLCHLWWGRVSARGVL